MTSCAESQGFDATSGAGSSGAEHPERWFRTAADATSILIWTAGPDARRNWFNRSWLDFTGRTMDQEIGDGWIQHVHPDDAERYSQTYRRSFDAREPFSLECRLRRHDGEYRWVIDTGIPRFAPAAGPTANPATANGPSFTSGEFLGHVGTCVDVTDQRVAREVESAADQSHATTATLEVRTEAAEAARSAAEDASRTAESANRAKSEFLAMMSHEFRTPLNAMIGYTQLLGVGVAGPLTDQQRDYVNRLSASTEHLLWLVNDVLDLSKIEAGRAAIVRSEAMTGDASSAALQLVDPVAAGRGVQLVDERPGGVAYMGDEHRVRQILLNLLSNAVKFSAPGGTVTIRCGHRDAAPANTQLHGPGSWAFIRVEDTGVGIPADEQARIFEPFHQVESGHTRKQGGTGLGLAISRQLAQLMGGDLTVESTLGSGSSFTLWLPTPEQLDAQQRNDSNETTIPTNLPISNINLAGLSRIGEILSESLEEIMASYGNSLRTDPETPLAHEMRKVLIEDHAASFVADLAQSLVIIADARAEAADLLRDGSAIQRAIAEAHGARRCAQGWDEASVRRDHAVLRREIERCLRSKAGSDDAALEAALRILSSLNERAAATGMRSWRRCRAVAAAR
jgi:PAS domain S-box-containing protein